MAVPPFVGARVTPEMKRPLRVFAESEQITESALVRQLEVILRMSSKDGFPNLDTLKKVSRDARLSVRLSPEDRILRIPPSQVARRTGPAPGGQ